ncbi:hypothetical protein GX888_02425 [Candidatus Dojkabacteria bacterium]|uniref:Deacetylase sirtuin-type domain-containing protein n=1 Tax=Candidatus Dojkabacteria bacterium TaxID=2099670 RepID=A0A847VDF0_9BACT|nr:hypothetical protein [Candidatus Dojkabacteria bacterium]
MESLEKQFNQPKLSETKEESRNFLLEGPELVLPGTERKQEEEMSFSFSSNTRRYYLGHKNGKTFFTVEYFDSLPDELSKEEKQKFVKETRKQGEVEKTVYTLKYGEVPEPKKENGRPGSSQSKKYCVAQPRDFERGVIDNFVAYDKNKQVMSEILAKHSELKSEEISQLVEQTFEASRKQNPEAVRTLSGCFSEEVAEKIQVEIREQMLCKPEEIGKVQLVEILKNKKVLFYTGAGISIASGVHSMDQLHETLGIRMSERVDGFLKKAVANPQEVTDSWEGFTKAAFEKPATPAHHSLGELAKKLRSQIFTENVDYLQEKVGVKPVHLTGPWLKENIQPEWLRDIDAVVTVGLSYDDRGFLGWYKENNPNGKIIAINLNQPSYLGNEDFVLKGDCQRVIPELEKEFVKKG